MLKRSPNNPETNAAAEDDLAACKSLIQTGSRSFYMASMLLPDRVRLPAYAIYAFCRVSDDVIDESEGCGRQAVAALKERLDLAYAGRPLDNFVDRAFAHTVESHKIPKALPEALLDGFAWDVEGRRYQTLSDLNHYSARVAGSVGAMMCVLMGVRDTDTLARACDLGVAMQLTNIARDVGEDARNGRIYLPLDWCDEAGIDVDAFLANPAFSPSIGAVTAQLLDAAETLYERAVSGIDGLPFLCRPAIHAARLIYREIGRVVSENGDDSVSMRAFVPQRRKAARLAEAVARATRSHGSRRAPALRETAYLVAAVKPLDAPVLGESTAAAWWDFDGQAARVIRLFEDLDNRERRYDW